MSTLQVNDLNRLRERINKLDEQLVNLLNDRAETARQLGVIKHTGGADVYDPKRERAVLERVASLNAGPLDKGALEEIFATIITVCREIQIR